MEKERALRHHRLSSSTLTVLCACVLSLTSCTSAFAQSTPRTPLQNEVERSVRELHSSIEGAERRTANLENILLPWVLLPLTVLVALLASGGVVGLVFSFKTEKRARESHDSLFRGSQETITLVNETLQLAKDASEQAATTMSHKAREGMMELDRAVRDMLKSVHETRDFKAIVKHDASRQALADVARSITSSERMLHAQEIELTPHCLFAKGLDLYLHSAPRAAIDCLQAVPTDSEHELSALALFWAGYESNNIGEFDNAIECFDRARGQYLRHTYQAQHFELRRCEIQAHFFDTAWNESEDSGSRRLQVANLVQELTDVIAELSDKRRADFLAERRHCHETIADMLFWCAHQ